jgi:hypothetical protein
VITRIEYESDLKSPFRARRRAIIERLGVIGWHVTTIGADGSRDVAIVDSLAAAQSRARRWIVAAGQ